MHTTPQLPRCTEQLRDTMVDACTAGSSQCLHCVVAGATGMSKDASAWLETLPAVDQHADEMTCSTWPPPCIFQLTLPGTSGQRAGRPVPEVSALA